MNYNRGQNKMEPPTAIPPFPPPASPPNQGWSRANSKARHFPILAWGEGEGQPRPQGFSLKKMGRTGRPTHFLREKPWGRGWGEGAYKFSIYFVKDCRQRWHRREKKPASFLGSLGSLKRRKSEVCPVSVSIPFLITFPAVLFLC